MQLPPFVDWFLIYENRLPVNALMRMYQFSRSGILFNNSPLIPCKSLQFFYSNTKFSYRGSIHVNTFRVDLKNLKSVFLPVIQNLIVKFFWIWPHPDVLNHVSIGCEFGGHLLEHLPVMEDQCLKISTEFSSFTEAHDLIFLLAVLRIFVPDSDQK